MTPRFTLRQWQTLIKPQTEIIYNASHVTEADGYVPFSIGVSIQYSKVGADDIVLTQIGDHKNLVVCNISLHTDLARRGSTGHCRHTIVETLYRNGIRNTMIDPVAYFRSLPTFKFVVSPEGNGIDCHRHYEAMLAGAVPIIEDHPMMREKYGACPVLFTRDYSECTAEYLEGIYTKMLDTEYDFSALLFSCQSDKHKKQIRTNGNYWGKRCTGSAWYPELSLCIPTMNRWSFLKESLPKYVTNPYIDEIIVCDETGEDAEKIRAVFPEVKIYVNTQRLGAFWNKHEVVSKATCPWVALLDSDNYAPPAYFEAWLAQRPHDPHVVYCPSRTLPTSNHGGFNYLPWLNHPLMKGNMPSVPHPLLVDMWLNTGNYIVARSTYLGCYDPAYEGLTHDDLRALEAKVRTWFLIKAGATLRLIQGMEYVHAVHDGSLYTTTPSHMRDKAVLYVNNAYQNL